MANSIIHPKIAIRETFRKIKKAEITVDILYETMQICLQEDMDFNTEERLYARVAYLNLNALRNSLHRFLVDKPKKSAKVKLHRAIKRKDELMRRYS